MKIESAMVLAAGFGTRMRELTENCPKPLLAVAGRPLIDHALDVVAEAGISRAIVNLHYRGEQIRAHLAGRSRPEILFSEEREILDTGGGVTKMLPSLGTWPFAVLNSDAVFKGPENPIESLAAHWEPERMDGLMLLVPTARAHAYSRAGDFFLAADGARPERRGRAAEAPLVFTGVQILSPAAFTGAPSGAFSLNLIWDRLIADDRLAAVIWGGDWVDVGTPEGLRAADELLMGAGT